MKVQIRRLILIASIGIIALLVLIYGFWPKPVLVEVARAVYSPFRVTIEEEGKTKVKDRFICSAPVAGFMRRIELRVGDGVKKGERLFVLEPLHSQVLDPRSRAEAQFAVSAAQASVKEAEEREQSLKVDVEFTAKRYARFKLLFDSGLITKDEFDRIETQAQQARAVYLAAQATTAVMRSELKRRQSVLADYAVRVSKDQETVVVRSPKSGRVLKLYRESEGAVTMGEPVIEIGDSKDIEVRVELLSADAVKIRPGTPVAFERWGGAPLLMGKVRTIEPSGFTKISSLGVEEQRVLVIVDMTSDANIRSQLGDGYRVEARFTVWEGQNVLQVPASALFRVGEKWAVFTVDNGRAARRTFVEVGHRNGLHAEILSGISEGAVVITQPDDAIKESGRIRVRTPGKRD